MLNSEYIKGTKWFYIDYRTIIEVSIEDIENDGRAMCKKLNIDDDIYLVISTNKLFKTVERALNNWEKIRIEEISMLKDYIRERFEDEKNEK